MKLRELFFRLCFVVMLALPLSVNAETPVNINTATAEEIATNLKGIGPSKAKAIVEYRESNGPFKHITELTNVKGVGDKTLLKNEGMISVGSDSGTATTE